MGRAKAGTAKAAKPVEEPERELIKLSNLYEAGALKASLDEVAREVVLDLGYEEDIVISNIKIFLGVAAIGFALLSQFGPGKFPGNWWMVLGCVIAYLVLTLIMNLYSWKMEADAFLVTTVRGGKGLRMTSRMGRYTDDYTLLVSDRMDPQTEVQGSFRVPDFFHEDGYMADAAWRTEVEKVCTAFSQKLAEKQAKKRD